MRILIYVMAFAALGLSLFAEETTMTVNATGVGLTADAAQKAALISAVQQVVGVYIDNETAVKNEQVLYDSILSLSDGFVTKFDVTTPARKRAADGLFEITITAVVQKGKVSEELQKRKLIEQIDTKDAWAEAVTTIKSAQDAIEVMNHKTQEMVTRLMTAKLIKDTTSESGPVRPQVKPDPSTGHAICAWNIEVGFDKTTYYAKVVPLLEKVFNSIAESKLPDFTVKAASAVPLSFPMQEPDYNIRRAAILGTPIRFLANRGNDAVRFPMIDRQNSIVVCLNYSADKSRQNLRFRAWILDSGLYEKWLNQIFTPRALKAEFADDRGDSVVEETISLEKTLIKPTTYNTGETQGQMGPIAIPKPVFKTPLTYWDSTCQDSSCPIFWITPDFRLMSHLSVAGNWDYFFGYTDSLVIHHEISLDPDDVKKIKSVQFSFIPKSAE